MDLCQTQKDELCVPSDSPTARLPRHQDTFFILVGPSSSIYQTALETAAGQSLFLLASKNVSQQKLCQPRGSLTTWGARQSPHRSLQRQRQWQAAGLPDAIKSRSTVL